MELHPAVLELSAAIRRMPFYVPGTLCVFFVPVCESLARKPDFPADTAGARDRGRGAAAGETAGRGGGREKRVDFGVESLVDWLDKLYLLKYNL